MRSTKFRHQPIGRATELPTGSVKPSYLCGRIRTYCGRLYRPPPLPEGLTESTSRGGLEPPSIRVNSTMPYHIGYLDSLIHRSDSYINLPVMRGTRIELVSRAWKARILPLEQPRNARFGSRTRVLSLATIRRSHLTNHAKVRARDSHPYLDRHRVES